MESKIKHWGWLSHSGIKGDYITLENKTIGSVETECTSLTITTGISFCCCLSSSVSSFSCDYLAGCRVVSQMLRIRYPMAYSD